MLKVVGTLCLFMVGTASADTYVVWAHRGDFVAKNARPCGKGTQMELSAMLEKTPVVTIAADGMALRVVDLTRKAAETYASEPTLGVFREGKKTLLILVYLQHDKPTVEISLIRQDASEACYEKWVGVAERS